LKRITLITTGQPTTNPRLVKEAVTLARLGYEVKVICCFYESWAQRFDAEITGKYPGMYVYCGGSPNIRRLTYWLTRVRQKIAFKIFGPTTKFDVAEMAISRTHVETLALAKKIKSDLYIAHNLGALPAAVMAAAHHQAKVGYDAEDMHSGQYRSNTDKSYRLNRYIEEKYFPATDYFTVASPLIGQAYKRLYSYLRPVNIDNVFPRTTVHPKKGRSGPLTLFWFSQTVGADRGLETTLSAMAQLSSPVELHLLGSCSDDYKNTLRALASKQGLNNRQLHFHEPIPADELFQFAAQFDIGIASETATTLNRDICLTNKIFVYVQCGLAIITSDTQAQTLFIDTYPSAGRLYHKQDVQSMFAAMDAYARNQNSLDSTKNANYCLGQDKLNWETERRKFLDVINKLFAN
jgi:glycosyltransferase involved in cell wall biosynthesis